MTAPPRRDRGRKRTGEEPRRGDLPSPAKVTPPTIPNAFPRTRLFRLLDEARRARRAVWVGAPAGAGKTTLVASYIAAHELPVLWYQLDAGDADAASFFYRLSQAARKLSGRRRPLPLLTPEYLAGLQAFARNFFRALFERIPPPAVVVFDNYESLPSDAPVQSLLAAVLEEAPAGITVIVLSRTGPPPAFARWRASDRLALVGWEALKLQPEETRGICRLRRREKDISAAATDALHQLTDGWVAGLMLKLAQTDARDAVNGHEMHSHRATFDYFAAEVLAHNPLPVREFLFKTALLPYVQPALAQALTENREAADLLADLADRNYFTTRLVGGAYQYHALFREFLLAQAQAHFTPGQWRDLQRGAARILVDAGLHEPAATLLQQSGDDAGLEALIHERAGEYAASGRLHQLEQWLRALPQQRVGEQPWLAYWTGVCRMPFDVPESRAHFERAYARFGTQDDVAGQYLALAAILDTFVYEWDDFAPVRRWIEELDRLEQRHPLPDSPALQSPVIAAVLGGACFGYPQYPRLPQWAARAEALLGAHPDIGDVAVVASMLALYYGWIGNFVSLRALVGPMRRLVQSQGASPLARLYAYFILAQSSWLTGAPEEAERYCQQGLTESAQSGVHVLDSFLLGIACFAHGLAGNTAGLREYLERMQGLLQPGRRLDFAHYHWESARAALLQRNHEEAYAHADTALKTTQAVACDFPSMLCSMTKAEALAALGRHDEADALAAQVRAFADGFGSRLAEFEYFLLQGWIALCRGEHQACRAALEQAFALGREQRYVCCYSWSPGMMTALCLFALEQGIEVEYVRRLVRERGLVPDAPPLHVADWPWKVRLSTLGTFTVLVDDGPLQFSTKAQKKPLELLKALIALGGRSAREDTLTEILWPEAEADSAAFALTTTVHRLRRLIGEAAIERREGRLALNASCCWVDVWAVEREIAAIEQASRGSSVEAIEGQVNRLLALYRGPFLADQADDPWVLSTRERLRGKFLRSMDVAANVFVWGQRHAQAIQCLEKALEVDPLVESFYRWIIQAHLAQGQRAAAMAAYRRCRETLAAHLGLEPSADTEALRRRINSS